MTLVNRRVELGRFLRQRRSRVRPADAGLQPLGRRHVRGLRRDEVAQLAGIGVSWYTMLEQGRVENVAPRTLEAVSVALALTAGEREHLRALAASAFEELDVDETQPPAAVLDFVRAFPLGGAFAHSSFGEVIAWNGWADAFFRFSTRGASPNMLGIMFGDASLRAQFIEPDWDDIVRRMVGHVRLRYGDAGSERFEHVLRELHAYPEFAAIWNERSIVAPPSEDGRVDHPVLGRRDVNVIAFNAPVSPTYSIVFMIEAIAAQPAPAPVAVRFDPPSAPYAESRDWRRSDLGGFLRHRRERLRPAEVGLVSTGRRHAKGLRRDEVAQLAGIGVSWYTMLEQGRVEHIRPKTLNAIANALRLAPRERAYLRHLAAQSFEELRPSATHPRPELVNFTRSYPLGRAFLHDARFDLVAWNAAADELFRFSAWPQPNVLQTIACTGALRERLLDPSWYRTLERLVEYLRFTSAMGGDIAGAAVVDELRSACPELAEIWARAFSVAAPPNDRMIVRAPGGGEEHAHFFVLVPSACPTYSLVLMNAIGQPMLASTPSRPASRSS